MPTLPRHEGQPHEQRQVAESFGTDAERYDRARPGYPPALVDRIIAGRPGCAVLDVGCGTGIVAGLFRAAGCPVLGIDPDARMADVAKSKGIDVEVATIESWDPAGRRFDAVVAGQAWHWIDPVAGAAKAAQALVPGGRLAVFWNSFQPPPELNAAFGAVYRRVLPDLPAMHNGMPGPDGYAVLGARAADGMRQAGGFDAAEEWRFDWHRPYRRDEWLDQVPTFGGFHQLSPDQQAEVLAGTGDAIDAVGGTLTMHYTTVVATALAQLTHVNG